MNQENSQSLDELDKETKKQFEEADKVLDKIEEDLRTRIKLEKKVFLKISDLNPEDALWFYQWCKKYTQGKQFLGIKVIRQIVERFDSFHDMMFSQITSLTKRMDQIEDILDSLVQQEAPSEPEQKLPRTQGSALRK